MEKRKLSIGIGILSVLIGALGFPGNVKGAELEVRGEGRTYEGQAVVVADGETKFDFGVYANNEHLMGDGTRGAIFELRRSPHYNVCSNGVSFPEQGDFFVSPRIVNYSAEKDQRAWRLLRRRDESEVEKSGKLANYKLAFSEGSSYGPMTLGLNGKSRLISKDGRPQRPLTLRSAKVLIVPRSEFDYNVDGFVDSLDAQYILPLVKGPGVKYKRGDLESKKMDLDDDGDVDLRDYEIFTREKFTGKKPVGI